MAKAGHLSYDMSMDEQGVVKAFEHVARANAKVLAEQNKLTAASRKAAREEAALTREAKKFYDTTRTPQEQHNARVKRLGVLLKRDAKFQDTYTRAVKQSKTAMNQAATAGKKAFGSEAIGMVKKFAGALGLTGGLAGAVMIVRKEWEVMIEKQRRFLESTTTEATAQIGFRRMLGATTQAEVDTAEAMIAETSKATGVSRRDIYARMTTAVSARGKLPVETAMRAVKESARLAPESAEQGEAIAGAALDFMAATRIPSVRANIGILMGIAQRSRVTDIGKIARGVAPALTAGVAQGSTARESGARWAAITGGATDERGRRAMTGLINLEDKLAEVLPAKDTWEWKKIKGVETQVLKRAGTGLTSGTARIAALQQDPMLREWFLSQEGVSFASQVKPGIMQIISGRGPVAEAYAKYLREMPEISVAEAEAIYEKQVGLIRGGPLQKTATMQRGIVAGVESLETLKPKEAQIAGIREQFPKIVQALGLGSTGTWLRGKRAEWSAEGPRAGYQKELEDVLYLIKHPRRGLRYPAQHEGAIYDEGHGKWIVPRELTPTDQKQIEILEGILQVIKDNQIITKEMVDKLPQTTPVMAPPLQGAGIGGGNN